MTMLRGTAVAFAFLLASAGQLAAQGNLGGLTGNVTDASGALIPGVTITLRNLETNAISKVTSGDGGYSFTALPPGGYLLEAEKAGFKKFVRERIDILTATASHLDIALDVGAVSESVTVAGNVVALQTDSPEIGTVLQRQALLDLPIEVGGGAATTAASGRRQPENFIFLTPGVQGIPWSKTINGMPDFTQEVLIDGISAQLAVTPGFLAQTSPPYESIQEFKVQNTLFPAEYGRGFGVINYTMKSGGNQFHGDLFEFFRNDKLDARPFFARTRPVVRYNEYGGWFGGPVRIPKVYDGRNRTFFDFNYTGLRNGPPVPGNLVSAAPPAFRSGDFSGYTDSSGKLIPIYDPATTQPNGGRTPFPGNIIPANRFSKVATNSLKLVPQPDTPGYFNNYVNRGANPVQDDVWSLKLDQIVTSRQRVSFSMWRALNDQYVNSVFGANGGPLGPWFLGHTPGSNWRVNYDYTVRPNLLQHFALGYTYSNPTRKRDSRQGNQLIQLPGVPPDAPGFPTFNITNNYGTLSFGNSDQQPNDPSENIVYGVVDDVTWIKGRHQLKAGVDIRFYHYNNYGATGGGGLSGSYSFNPLSTADLTASNASSLGNGWASFLLGEVYSGARLIPAPTRHMRNEYYAYYVEDIFKVSRKVTLTLGLRHEIPAVVHEADSLQSYLDLQLPNPAAGGRPGALAFLNSGQRLVSGYYRSFSPRVGLAYMLNEKTVIRTGLGLFWSPTNATSIGRFAGFFQDGFSYTQVFAQQTSGRLSALQLDTGVPAFVGTLPNRNPALDNGASIDYINPASGKPGYNTSWTFDVQRQLPANFLLDAGYVGQRGVNLPSGLENLNQVNLSYLGLGSALLADIDSAAAQSAGIRAPYPGFTGSLAQALRPFPQFTSINDYYQPIGWSNYQSLQVRLQRHFSNGLSLLAAYTLSKTLVSDSGYTGFGDTAAGSRPLDTQNRKLEKRLAGFDSPQVLVLSLVYELPFGKGKHYLNRVNSVANALLGGWQVNDIQRYSRGTPIGVGGGSIIPLFGGSNRPNRVLGQPVLTSAASGGFDPATDRYLNIDAFSQPPPFTIGNSGPVLGNVRTFGLRNEDFSALKDFRIHESHQVQFRAEFFNLFNRVIFGSPSANINSPATFGRIGSQSNSPRHIQFSLKYIF